MCAFGTGYSIPSWINDTLYQEVDSKGLFEDGNSNEYDIAIENLIEKNNILNEETKGLKREHEIQ